MHDVLTYGKPVCFDGITLVTTRGRREAAPIGFMTLLCRFSFPGLAALLCSRHEQTGPV